MSDQHRHQTSASTGPSKQTSEPPRHREQRGSRPVVPNVLAEQSIFNRAGSPATGAEENSLTAALRGHEPRNVPSSKTDVRQRGTDSSQQRERRRPEVVSGITRSLSRSELSSSLAAAAAAERSSNASSSHNPNVGRGVSAAPPGPTQAVEEATSGIPRVSLAASAEGGQLALAQNVMDRVLGAAQQDLWVEFLRGEIASRQCTLVSYEEEFRRLQTGQQLRDAKFIGINYRINWRRLEWITTTLSDEVKKFQVELALALDIQSCPSRTGAIVTGGRGSNERSPAARGTS